MTMLKPSLSIALLALVLSGCAGTIGTSPKGLEAPIEKAALKLASDIKEGGYRTVTTDELKKGLDEGKNITILSTLPADDDRAFGMLPKARSAAMPKSEKELTLNDKERLIAAAGNDKEQNLVVYCGFVACRRSHLGAKALMENGYKNVYRYPGGIAAWAEAGYPVVK
jgi:rhodanese-related sulfurtransferase